MSLDHGPGPAPETPPGERAASPGQARAGFAAAGRKVRSLPASLVVGGLLAGTFVVIALLSTVWTPHDPIAVDVSRRLLPPLTDGHLLGTDRLGRDVTSQIMAGSRNALLVSVASTTGAIVAGVLVGLTAAGAPRFWQETLSRLTDLGIAMPAVLVALVLATVMGAGRVTVIVALIVAFLPWAARVTIGPARQILAREFVEAAFAYGRGRWFVLFRHVLPNISSLIIVQATIMLAVAILAEAALSFLGVGAPPPTQSWGRLLEESKLLVGQAPNLVLFPGLAITIVVLGFMLLGNGIHALLDPHLQTLDPQTDTRSMAV